MDLKETKVVFSDLQQGLPSAVRECFEAFGGAKALLKPSGDVFIKINTVDLKKFCYTDPELVKEVIEYFSANGARTVYVIENCTQGNFTRLVFKATGIAEVCKQTGAIPVYLDETKAVPVFLETLESFIDISEFVYEHLIVNRDRNLYLSLPKLKTHSMTRVTLSIKNQFGFVHQRSRIPDHNYKLHQKFADIYRLVRPDFVLVDGAYATNHGHYIAEKNEAKCIVPMDLLIAGSDPLAVDIVASHLMGFQVDEVEHLRLSKSTGIGIADWNKIEIVNENLMNERRQQLTEELLQDFPPELVILRGEERCCQEGCKGNTEAVVEFFYRDHNGRGDFTILMGKGIPRDTVEGIDGRVHLAGNCAIEEHGSYLLRKLGNKNVTMSYGCNNLAETIYGLCRQMGVSMFKLVPTDPITTLLFLSKARRKGSQALIAKIF